MAQHEPNSRPKAPKPPDRKGKPPPSDSVYGGQWGRSGKQQDVDPAAPDRPHPIPPEDPLKQS